MQREVGLQPELGSAEERAERLASLLTLSYEPMLAWRLDGQIEFWNAGAERLYGFSSNEAVGHSSHALLQTEFPIEFTELRSKLLNEHYWSGELRHVCKDGREVIVDSRMQLLGEATVLEVNRDVSQIRALNVQRKQVEAALLESEQRLRWLASIVEFSDDAIVSKNLDGVITSWNRGAERVFGYTADEAIGQPITIVIPQDRHDEERAILTRIRRGERIDHFETVRQRKHGSLIVVSLTVSPVKDAEGKIVGASKSARDITEQKRTQEQIATLAREAEHRSKNLLATVQATVSLSQSDTPDGLKRAIEGRAIPGTCEGSLAIRRDTLDRCRVIDNRNARAFPVFQEGRRARANRWPAGSIRAEHRSGRCCNLARTGDQRRQVRRSVRAQWPD